MNTSQELRDVVGGGVDGESEVDNRSLGELLLHMSVLGRLARPTPECFHPNYDSVADIVNNNTSRSIITL